MSGAGSITRSGRLGQPGPSACFAINPLRVLPEIIIPF
jgi:hypothetical protein